MEHPSFQCLADTLSIMCMRTVDEVELWKLSDVVGLYSLEIEL
jgi:hypothetical protein